MHDRREFHIRQADVTDLSELVDFQLAMAQETEKLRLDLAVCRAGVLAVLEDPTLGRYWVCEIDGSLAACLLQTFEWSDWRNGMVWWIHSLYVAPPHRKQGLFRAMYDHLQKIVRADPQLRGLRLYVDRTNIAALEVYQRIGMNTDHYLVGEWIK